MKKILLILAVTFVTASTAFAGEISEDTVRSVAMGSGRLEIHSKIGAPHNISGNGSKETYKISDSKTAVLQYDGDTLSKGYIINQSGN